MEDYVDQRLYELHKVPTADGTTVHLNYRTGIEQPTSSDAQARLSIFVPASASFFQSRAAALFWS